jgi:hypothetical protein
MTKQEAIQEQIDNIMDSFEFDKVQTVMTALDWKWYLHEDIPGIIEIKQSARKTLNSLKNENRMSGSGGFYATKEEGEELGKPWVRISLFFGLEFAEDGVSYDK